MCPVPVVRAGLYEARSLDDKIAYIILDDASDLRRANHRMRRALQQLDERPQNRYVHKIVRWALSDVEEGA